MDNIKENKKTIIICIILLIIIGGIALLVNNKNLFNNEEIKTEDKIIKYEANQYIPIYVTESDMANKYLNDFKNLLITDLNGAYEVINDKYKNKKYSSFEIFKNNIEEEYSVEFYKMNVKEYSVQKKGDYNYYYIRNNRDDLYVFKELSIMNYEVFLDDYTVEIK